MTLITQSAWLNTQQAISFIRQKNGQTITTKELLQLVLDNKVPAHCYYGPEGTAAEVAEFVSLIKRFFLLSSTSTFSLVSLYRPSGMDGGLVIRQHKESAKKNKVRPAPYPPPCKVEIYTTYLHGDYGKPVLFKSADIELAFQNGSLSPVVCREKKELWGIKELRAYDLLAEAIHDTLKQADKMKGPPSAAEVEEKVIKINPEIEKATGALVWRSTNGELQKTNRKSLSDRIKRQIKWL